MLNSAVTELQNLGRTAQKKRFIFLFIIGHGNSAFNSVKVREFNIWHFLSVGTLNELTIIVHTRFCLYVNLPFSFNQVLSLNETDYFFDSLRQITDWSKRSKRVNQGESVCFPLNGTDLNQSSLLQSLNSKELTLLILF